MFAVIACNAIPLRANYENGEIGFENFATAYINLLTTLTTENYPDIMHNTLIEDCRTLPVIMTLTAVLVPSVTFSRC